MHIAYIITQAKSIGGAQIHVRDLALEMASLGHQATVLTASSVGNSAFFERAGVKAIGIQGLKREISLYHDFRAYHHLVRTLKSIETDVISTHSSKAGWLGRLAARRLGIPAIFTAHGWAFADGVPPLKRLIYTNLERIAARISGAIITVSEADAALSREYRVAPPNLVIPIHNGMPWIGRREQPGQRRKDDPVVRLCMIARFAEQKDHELLLYALSELRDLPWSLGLVGDGPYRDMLSSLCKELQLDDRVVFHGQVPDSAPYLEQSDVYLLISKWEGFPRSILEAMRAGLPVVASDVGGVRESVVDNHTGYLIPRGNRDLLVERLRELLTSSSLREQFGEAGRTRYEQEFTFGRMFEETYEVYLRLANENAIHA